jgi:hypothetical protein
LQNENSSFGGITEEELQEKIKEYIAENNLMTKDQAKQALLDDGDVFTADQMKELALGVPVIQVKNGVATVSIQVKKVGTLNGEWETVEDGELTVEITPDVGKRQHSISLWLIISQPQMKRKNDAINTREKEAGAFECSRFFFRTLILKAF